MDEREGREARGTWQRIAVAASHGAQRAKRGMRGKGRGKREAAAGADFRVRAPKAPQPQLPVATPLPSRLCPSAASPRPFPLRPAKVAAVPPNATSALFASRRIF